MHLKTRNINTGFRDLVSVFSSNHGRGGTVRAHWEDQYVECEVVSRPSRNGNVLVINEPVTVTYNHPRERVLLNAVRDANPAFHIYEALWMLAGRNDVAPLAYYNKRMTEFSDNGMVLNGAYGYRWRKKPPYRSHPTAYNTVVPTDQLDVLVNHLKADPTSRRAVLSMWNVEDDLLKIGTGCGQCAGTGVYRGRYTPDDPTSPHVNETCEDCDGKGKHSYSLDVCCNLNVMFSLRRHCNLPITACNGSGWVSRNGGPDVVPCPNNPGQLDNGCRLLDMTVTNRSNDLLWGMLGANHVHFSFLQEYVAARLGAEVGVYHHFTNNLHVYADRKDWRPEELLDDEADDPYTSNRVGVSLVKDPAAFEAELPEFVRHHDGTTPAGDLEDRWTEPFLSGVAGPLLAAFAYHKEGSDHRAFSAIGSVTADDWRTAADGWLKRRIKK